MRFAEEDGSEAFDDFVQLAEHFYARPCVIESTPEDGYPFNVRVTVDPNAETGRLQAVSVTVDDGPITSSSLRLVRIGEFVHHAGMAVQWRGPGRVPGTHDTLAASYVFTSERNHLKTNGFDDTGLAVLARIYRHALIVEGTPTKAVEEAFGLSRPMARHWIKQAREKGLLGAAEGRGKAGV